MTVYESPSHDAFFNMALEEALLEQPSVQDGCLLLWQNRNAVVVGRHQNTPEEVDMDFAAAAGIQVVRRLSGGGAMYQDLGNLNFTFVLQHSAPQTMSFLFFIKPVVRALEQMGVQAQAAGRNDILVAGKKISGNAQLRRGNRVLHHGTLLFCSQLNTVAAALRGKQRNHSRGVASVRSRITNIADHLPHPMPLAEFKALLLAGLAAQQPLQARPLPAAILEHCELLRRQKYATDQWNYGAGPAWNLRRERRFAFGNVCVLLDVNTDGRIRTAHIYGDFFGGERTGPLASVLEGLPLQAQSLAQGLAGVDVESCVHGLNAETLVRLLVDE